MMDPKTTPSIEWLTSVVLDAGESIDIAANLDPRTRFGSTLADALGTVTAMADQRLRLRCLIHWPTDVSGRAQVRADFFGDEISRIGWEVRTISAQLSMDLIVVDGTTCHAILDDGRALVTSAADDATAVRTLRRHFEELWSAAVSAEGPEELVFENLLRPVLPAFRQSTIRVSRDVWDRIIAEIARTPDELYRMDPRQFEELVAELLVRDGLEVQLTPKSRDGGRDILAFQNTATGRHLHLVECKRYARDRPIGVALVRSLYGVVEQERATAGLLVTTSRFTQDALEFVDPIRYRMSLREFQDLKG